MTLLTPAHESRAAQLRRQLDHSLTNGLRTPCRTKSWQMLLQPPTATRFRGFGSPQAASAPHEPVQHPVA